MLMILAFLGVFYLLAKSPNFQSGLSAVLGSRTNTLTTEQPSWFASPSQVAAAQGGGSGVTVTNMGGVGTGGGTSTTGSPATSGNAGATSGSSGGTVTSAQISNLNKGVSQ